jgi:cytochrome b subunit of formate dehydrogenase
MAPRRWPRTDVGTVILHWLAASAFVWLAATGLRIASDDVGNQWLLLFKNILPVEQLWLNHMLGAYLLTATAVAYLVYIKNALLFSRIKLDIVRLSGLFSNSRARWAALNILLYWWFFANLLTAIATGWLLYSGLGAILLQVHLFSVYAMLPFPLVHVIVHAKMGGIGQLARIVRPSALPEPVPAPDLTKIVAELLAERRNQALGANKGTQNPQPVIQTEQTQEVKCQLVVPS